MRKLIAYLIERLPGLYMFNILTVLAIFIRTKPNMKDHQGITDLIDYFWLPEFSGGFSNDGIIWLYGSLEPNKKKEFVAFEIKSNKVHKIYKHIPKHNLIKAEAAFVDGKIEKVFPKLNCNIKLVLKYNNDIPYHEEIHF